MLSAEEIDALTEEVIRAVLADEADAGTVAFSLARTLAQKNPSLPALILALPFSMAGNAIETMLGGGHEAREKAQATWRIAALIAADLAVLQGDGRATTMASLCAHWQADDPVFRDRARDGGPLGPPPPGRRVPE